MTTYYIQTDADGRLLAASEDETSVPDGTAYDVPDGFPWEDMPDWRIDGGKLVCEPLPPLPPSPVAQLREGQDAQMDAIAELGVLAADSAVSLDDVMDAIAELGAIVAEGV